MALAGEVAKYIIKSLPVDNLKLQKLLYYSQAAHLVLNKVPLFPEPIEAWDYGPVVPPVYQEYKSYGFDILPPLDEPVNLELGEIRSVDMAIDCFGEMSGPALINQTHGEPPWKNHYRPGRPSNTISLDSIYGFFKNNLEFTEDEINQPARKRTGYGCFR
ncbi:MAG: DUF4065 domain-containing protein [Spirochaetales bacterium]|jgi:uncharacterized phage-associated protein|nr:DUF4065 domain-containing protein [Spirochaetales bacterium]